MASSVQLSAASKQLLLHSKESRRKAWEGADVGVPARQSDLLSPEASHVSAEQEGLWKPLRDQWLETPLPFFRQIPRRYYRVLLVILLLAVGAAAAYISGDGFQVHPAATVASTNTTTSGHGPNPDQPESQYVQASGQAAQIPLLLLWTFACHNSIWTFLVGIPFERALFWHKFMVWLSLGLGLHHGILGQLGQGEDDSTRVTGWVLEAIMWLLVLLSLGPVRRAFFELFYRTHWLLFVVCAAVAAIHGAGASLVGAALWALDVLIRTWYMAGHKHAKKGEVARLPCNVVRIAWPKGSFEYVGGQYVFICVPAISLWQWHPFSLSSHPTADKVTLHIRVLGNWTRQLYDIASQSNDAQPIKFFFEGPYGSPSVNIFSDQYKMFLLIAGGIGITPMQSLVNTLMADAEHGRPLNKVWFVWSVRDNYLVEAVLPHDHAYERKQRPARLPKSFSPDMIQTQLVAQPATVQPDHPNKDDMMLHTEFYLTKCRDSSGFGEANIKPDLQPYLRFGRPDLPQIFSQMAELARSYKECKVATLVCGPSGMVNQVRHLSSKHSQGGAWQTLPAVKKEEARQATSGPDLEAGKASPQTDDPLLEPDEHEHYSQRAPWLRAGVLGANDGLVSVASLMIGVGGGSSALHIMILAGLAGLVGGALSMAVGEYISVASQKDSEKADIEKEKQMQAKAFITTHVMRIVSLVLATTAALTAFGALGAGLGGANMLRGAARVILGGWIALGITYGIGRAFGSGAQV
ncbi:hypothetical protein WJX82_001997 [Trebouxia sp. C0006]